MAYNGNLLVVDWDYFFRNPAMTTNATMQDVLLYDWSCREDDNHQEHQAAPAIWAHRAAMFLANGLPLPQPDPAWETFWDRFTLAEHAGVYVADSNVYAYAAAASMRMLENVDLYDAHHDAAAYPAPTGLPNLHCGNWMTALEIDYGPDGMHAHLPPWRDDPHAPELDPAFWMYRTIDDGQPVTRVYDTVFICRSPAWVPPWCDNAFERFITHPKLLRLPWEIDPNYTGPRSMPLRQSMSAISVMAAQRGRMGPTSSRGTWTQLIGVLAQEAMANPTHPSLHTVPCDLKPDDMDAFWPAFLDIPHHDQAALDALIVRMGHHEPTRPADGWHANLVLLGGTTEWAVEWTWAPDPTHLPPGAIRHNT